MGEFVLTAVGLLSCVCADFDVALSRPIEGQSFLDRCDLSAPVFPEHERRVTRALRKGKLQSLK
jgi:hypothetical protein